MGLVVFVFATVLMLAEGLEKTLVTTGNRENVVFLRRSAEAEVQSIVPRDQAAIVEDLVDMSRGVGGARLVSREVVVLIGLKKKGMESLANVLVRGISSSNSLDLRPQVRIAAGRMLQPGRAEVVIGRNIMERFAVGGLGESLNFGARKWMVVGIMESGGTGFDSEVWGDSDLLMATFRRPVYSSLLARLGDPSQFQALRERVLRDPRLSLDVWRESDYYAAQSQLMSRFIRVLGITLTFIFSLGAVIGSMVTMYGAVANRVSEIGTLRSLGFRRRTVLSTFMVESILLSGFGGFLGLGGAALLDRFTISTMNWQTFSELSFRFTLNRHIAMAALAFAVCMGVAGGVFPAVRAARLEIVEALRVK